MRSASGSRRGGEIGELHWWVIAPAEIMLVVRCLLSRAELLHLLSGVQVVLWRVDQAGLSQTISC